MRLELKKKKFDKSFSAVFIGPFLWANKNIVIIHQISNIEKILAMWGLSGAISSQTIEN